MNINSKIIDNFSIFYIILPLIIFLINWLNPPTLIISLFSLFFILKLITQNIKKSEFKIDTKLILFTIILCLTWCFFSGIGGFIYQSPDWHVRNALLRDLIKFSYPVIYDNGSALVYYISTFLPSALVGKMCLFFNISHEKTFLLANLFNYLYCSLGLILITFQIYIYCKGKNLSHIWILIIFIFFSGMDILVDQNYYSLNILHIERHGLLQYSSNTTLLFWVYNQAIIPWLITMLFIKNYRKVENYGFYGVLLFFTSPMPFIGLTIYLTTLCLTNLIRRINTPYIKNYINKIFSIQNILSIFIILPIIYLYYSSNATASENKLNFIFDISETYLYANFIFLEVGLYFLLIREKFKKNIIYTITLISLITLPFFQIGEQPDICMRSSICGLFILMLFIIKFLNDNNIKKIKKSYLIICLCIGAITPFFEIYRGIYYSLIDKKNIIKDEIYTLNNKIDKNNESQLLTTTDFIPNYGNYKNYGTINPNKQIFFKYLVKKK